MIFGKSQAMMHKVYLLFVVNKFLILLTSLNLVYVKNVYFKTKKSSIFIELLCSSLVIHKHKLSISYVSKTLVEFTIGRFTSD